MFFNFRVLIHTLVFFVIMELAAFNDQQVLYLATLLIGLTLWGVRKIMRRFIFSAVPVVFSVSAVFMLYLIDSLKQKNAFIVLSSIVYYLSLFGIFRLRGYQKDQTARGIVAASASAALFLFYASVYGFYLNFAIPLWILMAVFMTVTHLVAYEYFSIINPNRQEVVRYSLILALLMGEMTWVASFWPFGYLSAGAILILVFYLFWDLTQSHFLRNLSQKRLIANLIFLGVAAGIILATSRWFPAV